jgi:hypothetical protein
MNSTKITARIVLPLSLLAWLAAAPALPAQQRPAVYTPFNQIPPGPGLQPRSEILLDQAAPALLPGNGLAEHDFFYAGESKEERMCLVRGGKIVWSYIHPAAGEISDATLLANGDVLFAHQHGVTEINADKQVVWNYDAPTNTEIHTAQRFGRDHVWFIQNGNPALLKVVNTATGGTEREFTLPVGNPSSTHGQFRHARLTAAGTLLVAHMDMGRVAEYDSTGKEVWSVAVPGPWSATPLTNGNILVCTSKKSVLEIDHAGRTVWEWSAADAPGYKFSSIQLATRLPNGHTLINNWFNQWSSRLDPANTPVQAIAVTADKKIVWALRAWTPPTDLGPSTTIQLLDEPATSAELKFGDIH